MLPCISSIDELKQNNTKREDPNYTDLFLSIFGSLLFFSSEIFVEERDNFLKDFCDDILFHIYEYIARKLRKRESLRGGESSIEIKT